MEESTMSTLDIELANAITRDRERKFRDRSRIGNARQIGATMNHPNTTTRTTFDDLFKRLLSTVAEEHDIEANGGTVKTLIDVRDRLQGLRSDLAAVRNRLVTETTARLSDRQPPRHAV